HPALQQRSFRFARKGSSLLGAEPQRFKGPDGAPKYFVSLRGEVQFQVGFREFLFSNSGLMPHSHLGIAAARSLEVLEGLVVIALEHGEAAQVALDHGEVQPVVALFGSVQGVIVNGGGVTGFVLIDKRGRQTYINFKQVFAIISGEKAVSGRPVILLRLLVTIAPEVNVAEVLLYLARSFGVAAIEKYLAGAAPAFKGLVIAPEHCQCLQLVDLSGGGEQGLLMPLKALSCLIELTDGEFRLPIQLEGFERLGPHRYRQNPWIVGQVCE